MKTSFEDRLLAELRQVVESRPAPASEPSPRRTPPRRVGLTLGAGTAVAATAAAVVVLAGSGSDTPAYAVDRQDDGTVTVEINSLRDADGLERKLRAAGVPAEVDYTPAGKMCREPRGKPASQTGMQSMSGTVRDDGPASFTFARGQVKPGQTLVIQGSLGEGVSLGMSIVEGPVAACELVDAPAIPAGPGYSTRSGSEKGVTRSSGRGDTGAQSLHTSP